MKSIALTHVILYTAKLSETKHFWNNVLGLKNISPSGDNPSYKIGEFTVTFSYLEKAPENYSQIIGHFGFEFPSKADIDEHYQRLKNNFNLTIPGPFKDPYRFYVKDPNGIPIEFETWEGSTNPSQDKYF